MASVLVYGALFIIITFSSKFNNWRHLSTVTKKTQKMFSLFVNQNIHLHISSRSDSNTGNRPSLDTSLHFYFTAFLAVNLQPALNLQTCTKFSSDHILRTSSKYNRLNVFGVHREKLSSFSEQGFLSRSFKLKFPYITFVTCHIL